MAKSKKSQKAKNLFLLIIVLIIVIAIAILFNYLARKYGFIARPITYDISPFAKI